MAKLQADLPVRECEDVPDLTAYLERLDELFGEDWEQDVQGTPSGVRCGITIDHTGVYLKRVAIADTMTEAFKLCCHMLGMGRSQRRYS